MHVAQQETDAELQRKQDDGEVAVIVRLTSEVRKSAMMAMGERWKWWVNCLVLENDVPVNHVSRCPPRK
jgi:hypothetical protein